MDRQNPEALHDIGQSTEKKVKDAFVNPGTPAEPLVSREQMTQATIKGAASQKLKDGIIK